MEGESQLLTKGDLHALNPHVNDSTLFLEANMEVIYFSSTLTSLYQFERNVYLTLIIK